MPVSSVLGAQLVSISPQLCAVALLVFSLLLAALWLVRPDLVDMALGIAQLGFDKANAKFAFDLGRISDAIAGELGGALDLNGMKDVKGSAASSREANSDYFSLYLCSEIPLSLL
jgi:hypothetical protein